MKSYFKFVYLSVLLVFLISPSFAATYDIDTDLSYLHVLTERGGLLKSLSHPHVVELGPLNAQIDYNEDEVGSTVQWVLSPEQFIVDRPKITKQYPEIWDESVDPKQAKGTTKNMLSKKLLYASQYPDIVVDILLTSTQPVVFNCQITIKDQIFEFSIPGELVVTEDTLNASADVNLSHKQLGLKPFKAGAGAIAVGKSMRFLVNVTAIKSVTP